LVWVHENQKQIKQYIHPIIRNFHISTFQAIHSKQKRRTKYVIKVTNNIVCLGLGLILVICLTGCSAQSFKTGTAFEINENDSSQTNTAIENSLRASGVSNPIVQTLGGNNFLVEIPSSNDASKIMTILEQHAIISSQASISASIGNPMTMKNATALIYEADLSLKDPSETDAQVMAAVQSKLLRRLSASGISGPVIQIWVTIKS